ncbi:hypothetical protein HMPREF1861_00953 [Corynebacterium kroppenstedtii]|nr:hypothetical protein HMPREF1861_00953 [Corynebacterium kroppenstedtii]
MILSIGNNNLIFRGICADGVRVSNKPEIKRGSFPALSAQVGMIDKI